MAISVTEVTREFKFHKSGGEVIPLTDIDRNMDYKDVVDYHTIQYPELVSAVLKVDNKGDKLIYNLDEKLGTKG